MNWRDYISFDPAVCHGKACIMGTRVMVTVAEQGLAGAEDHDIASVCLDEGRILLTLDLDFADVRAYPPHRYPGLIVLRISSQTPRRQMEVVSRILPSLSDRSLQGQLWVVEDSRIRVRE